MLLPRHRQAVYRDGFRVDGFVLFFAASSGTARLGQERSCPGRANHMKLDVDPHKLEVSCPQCGHVITATVGRLKRDPGFLCPQCIHAFTVDAKALKKRILLLEKALEEKRRALSKLEK